jgi:predicted flap endonuclease-1-like 5' DNA nuclease
MTWLQENWIIAVVGLVVAVVLLWWLFGRSKPQEIAPPVAEPAKPAKPLEPVKPEIIAAEPARFKPIEPKAQPVAAAPPPAPEPAAKAPAPAPAAEPAPVAEPIAEAPPPAPKPAAKPKTAAKPAAKKTAAKDPATKPAAKPATKAAAKPAAKKAASKPTPAEAAAIPAEPTVPPPPPAAKPAAAPAKSGADNLQLLKGVGPKLVVLLNGLGVTSFRQIADWTDADVARIDPQLGAFQGRIARDAIVDQAGYLARGDKAGFEAKYGALGGEL